MCDMTTYVAIPEDLILPADLLPDDDVIGVCWVAVVIGDSVEDIAEIIAEEYDAADIPRANGDPWIGHVFITGQQIEAYIEFEGDAALDMAYGAILTDEEDALPDREADELYETKTLAMMTDIVLPTLAKHGVETQWSGSIADLVTLTNAVYYQPI